MAEKYRTSKMAKGGKILVREGSEYDKQSTEYRRREAAESGLDSSYGFGKLNSSGRRNSGDHYASQGAKIDAERAKKDGKGPPKRAEFTDYVRKGADKAQSDRNRERVKKRIKVEAQ